VNNDPDEIPANAAASLCVAPCEIARNATRTTDHASRGLPIAHLHHEDVALTT
jgi:hypothetical protein